MTNQPRAEGIKIQLSDDGVSVECRDGDLEELSQLALSLFEERSRIMVKYSLAKFPAITQGIN